MLQLSSEICNTHPEMAASLAHGWELATSGHIGLAVRFFMQIILKL